MGVCVLRAYFHPRAAVISGFIAVNSSLRDGNLSSFSRHCMGGTFTARGPDHSRAVHRVALINECDAGRARDARAVLSYG